MKTDLLGSQLIIGALRQQGVTTIFSLSGNQIMPLYDACIDAGIRIVHVRHEAAAVFMADAWAQVTGELGVAMLTAAPGITNGIGPLYSASQAESPVLLISGDSPVAEDGSGAFQELDQASITRPITKWSHRPLTTQELLPSLHEAIGTAMAPRRGPVHLALPFDLMTARTGLDALPAPAARPAAPAPDANAVRMLATLLDRAERPLMLAGPSGARAHAQAQTPQGALERFPGLAIIPMESPRGLNDPSAGTLAEVMPQADLVVLAGKCLDFTLRFGRKGVFADDARIAVVDPDPRMLERARRLLGGRLALELQADPGAVLAALSATPPSEGQATSRRSAWLDRVKAALADRTTQPVARPAGKSLSPREISQTVQAFIESQPDAIVVCDGGEFGQWAQAFCHARTRIINGMSGAIGGGICYAIAAKIARPESTVVALMGDGTAGFHMMELDTAAREGAAIIAVIGNDLRWNAEHLIQMRSYGPQRLIGCELSATAKYHEVAAALGGVGHAVDDTDGLARALRSARDSGRPACINVALAGEAAPAFGAPRANATGH